MKKEQVLRFTSDHGRAREGFTFEWKCPDDPIMIWDSTKDENLLDPDINFWGNMSDHQLITDEFGGRNFWVAEYPDMGYWETEVIFDSFNFVEKFLKFFAWNKL